MKTIIKHIKESRTILPNVKEKIKLPKNIKAKSNDFVYTDYIDYNDLTEQDHLYLCQLSYNREQRLNSDL